MRISELKLRAKEVLKNSYWWSVLVSFILAMLGGGLSAGGGSASSNLSESEIDSLTNEFSSLPSGVIITIVLVVVSMFLFIYAIGFAMKAFLTNPVQIGHNSFYIKAANGYVDFGNIGDGFKYKYMNGVKTMFLRDLYVALWNIAFILPVSLVFIFVLAYVSNGSMSDLMSVIVVLIFSLLIGLATIPGMIKYYEYFMIEYIIAENPYISSKRAFEISKQTMKGSKWKAFSLYWAFFGWFLLGVSCCCVGIYFVMPYYYATATQFYFELREKAIKMGYADYSDFSMQNYKTAEF